MVPTLLPHLGTFSRHVGEVAPAKPGIPLTELRDLYTACGGLHRGIKEVEPNSRAACGGG